MERLTTESAGLLQATIREARRLLAQTLYEVRTIVEQPTRAQIRAVLELAQFMARAEQVRRRFAAERIPGGLVSVFDVHARLFRLRRIRSRLRPSDDFRLPPRA